MNGVEFGRAKPWQSEFNKLVEIFADVWQASSFMLFMVFGTILPIVATFKAIRGDFSLALCLYLFGTGFVLLTRRK